MKKTLQILCLLGGLLSHQLASGQSVSGVVSDAEGQPIPGVNILVEGTTKGTVTDMNGSYSITLVDNENVLIYSFVGFVTQRIEVNGRTTLNVTLAEDINQLEEVVVIGYGTMQEKDLTSAITTVEAEEIAKTPTSQAMQALQGRVAGLQVVSSGAPGASPTVRVRGIGTFEGNSAPLYVVDGMFFDNIDFLNTADIETITVLKDASSTAIFGVRASNGVVLIETKSGSYDSRPQITYNGYYGIQNAQNVLQMSNSEQFVRYINETGDPADISFVDNAFQRFGRSDINPNVPNVNTDWYDEVIQTAPIQNHTLTFSGGNQDLRYSVSGSIFDQEGLMRNTRNSYTRINLRTKLDFKANDWLNLGGNVLLSGARQYVGEDAAWFRSYFAVPILPVYDDQNTNAFPEQLANAQVLGYRGSQNPFFPLLYNDNRNNIGKVLGNFYLDFKILPDNLSFKTQLNYTFENINARNVDFPYSDGQTEFLSGISRSSTTVLNTIWDNYLTYENNWGAHGLTAVLGYSFRNETFERVFARGENLNVPIDRDREELWYLRFGESINADATGDAGAKLYGGSYFGRLAYNYDDRYLVYATLRREGTNRIQDTWDIFPTIGAGWIASEEDFFNVNFINWLKFRASWGRLGNDGISPALGAPERNPVFLAVNDQRLQGTQVVPVFDLIDSWEFTEEINVGLSARMLNNRLSVEADYYVRDTEDAVITVNLPLIRNNVRRNLGQIRNQGLEMAVNWSDQVGSDLTYNIGFNFATLQNEVLSLGGQEYIDHGQAEFRQRSIIGQPFEAFFGYETMGIFQTTEEINNSGLTQEFIADNNLVPGDFIYKDQNGDGVIDDQDRVVLGSYLPDITYGFNFAVNYRAFGISATFQGQAGHNILNRKRGEIIFTTDTNIDAELANNIWRGEGTSNRYPSAAGLRKGYNQSMSDYYVEEGAYFRIQNVQLSYRLTNKEIFGTTLPETTFLVTAERPLTVFNYNGFNPEVPNGIDRQTYPIPAIYTVGLNVTF